MAWNFISALYKSEWDTLVTDKDNKSFRQKIVSKFTLKIQEIKTKSVNNKKTDKPASFAKLPPLIPAKTPKEAKEIFRFFKQSSQLTEKKGTKKLYAQASCYELKLKGLSNRTTLVLSNTRELDRVSKTK